MSNQYHISHIVNMEYYLENYKWNIDIMQISSRLISIAFHLNDTLKQHSKQTLSLIDVNVKQSTDCGIWHLGSFKIHWISLCVLGLHCIWSEIQLYFQIDRWKSILFLGLFHLHCHPKTPEHTIPIFRCGQWNFIYGAMNKCTNNYMPLHFGLFDCVLLLCVRHL